VIACDFYITGAETFTAEPWGYRCGRIINIDHHAPTPRMARLVSSANLALLWAREKGHAGATDRVVINHTDCDSVLSSGIVTGELEPLAAFGQAALAADHSGKPDPIADLLQALDARRDYDLSLRNLRCLLDGATLEPEAQAALDVRLGKRATAAQLVAQGRFTHIGPLAFAVLEEAVDGEFFPALLPQATLIVMCSPRPQELAHWNVKLRLGQAAPDGFSLHDLHLREFDEHYGGRWNAGSNKRGGGTSLTPEAYAAGIAARLQALLRRPA